ncbi:CaiB/BaiF CoA transferase family protein, partial [Paraburkholderia sp. BR14262]
YEQLSAENPRLIYCSISGYDRTGPEATRPGYDLVVQGETGLMAMNGEAHQPPLKFGVAAVDLFTGMYSAQAMLAALYERERTGRGRHIEMALFDCGLMITAYYGLEALLIGEDPPRYGNAHPSIVPYGVFDAADGPLVITVGNNAQFERFCREVIERADLADDARYKTNILRGQNRETLAPELTRELGSRPRKLLLERLARAGIPCGEVAGLREALLSPRATRGGLVTQQPHPHTESGTTPVLAPPWRFDGERLPVRHAPPQLGEGTQEVLQSMLGYSAEQLAGLKEKGVI